MTDHKPKTGELPDTGAARMPLVDSNTERSVFRGSGLGFSWESFGDSKRGAAPHIPLDDVAAYMADMLLELRTLARDSGFETLGRVLEIAEGEAKLRARGPR